MGRSTEYEIRDATALLLAEAIDRLELAQIPVCPDPVPAFSEAQQAHARACFGVGEEIHSLLAEMHETSTHGPRATRH